uniref:Macaca fascicularis brain cDNA clone: QflA-16556, similar to human hypothetical protein FLJ22344 (FLJ22344), mRNA, RefSeq: NM_024717.2 n=1 Tax=Macaca fascicularis TaxID=9541 RepID=I7GI25_MACFA|nr:unnamed protein product [Macaca fascicularis]
MKKEEESLISLHGTKMLGKGMILLAGARSACQPSVGNRRTSWSCSWKRVRDTWCCWSL